jgi:hypothetical protein
MDMREFVEEIVARLGACTNCPGVAFCENDCPLNDGKECTPDTALKYGRKWLEENTDDVETVYKALDGSVFNTLAEAKQHNKSVSRKAEVAELIEDFMLTLDDDKADEDWGTDRERFGNYAELLVAYLDENLELN